MGFLQPAPSVTFDDGRRTAHLTVKLPSQSLSGKTLTATLTDGNRAAEFLVEVGEPTSTGTAGSANQATSRLDLTGSEPAADHRPNRP